MAPSQGMSLNAARASRRGRLESPPREGLPIARATMGEALPKKGGVPGSARIPGVFKPALAAHLGVTMEPKHPNPGRLVPLIPILNRRARRLARSPAEAEDLVQDTLLSLCQRLREGHRIDDLPSYAMRTLSNRARRGCGTRVSSR